jgi:hypothetical protein
MDDTPSELSHQKRVSVLFVGKKTGINLFAVDDLDQKITRQPSLSHQSQHWIETYVCKFTP